MRGDITLNHEELIICERLRALKMSGMADASEDQMLDPNADLVPFIENSQRSWIRNGSYGTTRSSSGT